MKFFQIKIVIISTALALLFFIRCSSDKKDSIENPVNRTIVGKWYAASCGFADAQTWNFGADGKGYVSTKDCSGTCNPRVLNFSYTVTGDVLNCVYDAVQPVVHCNGSADSSPAVPSPTTQTYTIDGNSLRVTSGATTKIFISDNPVSVVVSDNLHFDFTTPDWNRTINCELLNFFPNSVNDSTYNVSATSQSTNAVFCLSYPKDSTNMVKAKIFKNHKIMSIYENKEPFQFSLKLDLDANSIGNLDKRMVSFEGFSATEYNQITEVKYLASEPNYAVFRVKCKYEMKMYLASNPTVIKPVSGTLAFKIRTTKN